MQVERPNGAYLTFWISITNLTTQPVSIEAHYNILSRFRTEKEENSTEYNFAVPCSQTNPSGGSLTIWPGNNDLSWMVLSDHRPGGLPYVAFERAGNNTVTYWLTIHNLTGDQFDFEARYNFLN